MTKLEAIALAVFSIVVMYGVFWGKAVFFDAPAIAQEGDNWHKENGEGDV